MPRVPRLARVLWALLKLAPSPSFLYAGMEEAARKLLENDGQDLRMLVYGILRSSKLPKDKVSVGGSEGHEGLGQPGYPAGGQRFNTDTGKSKIKIRPTWSQPPRLYGLPKIHKQSVPLRPIVSCIGSPSYQLSKYIASIISPLAGKTSSHVLNSKHFSETMRDITISSDESLVSFDVTYLFTNVPIKEVIRGKLWRTTI